MVKSWLESCKGLGGRALPLYEYSFPIAKFDNFFIDQVVQTNWEIFLQ